MWHLTENATTGSEKLSHKGVVRLMFLWQVGQNGLMSMFWLVVGRMW